MDPPTAPKSESNEIATGGNSAPARSQSFSSHKSNDSHTAAEFIRNQLQLEAEAREALPYKFDNCTKPLGPLRQMLFACLTCNPPPESPADPYTTAGICYSCSVQCHGEHTLVELFNKRQFECDCGTTRFPATSPCNIRIDPKTNGKGVHSETPNSNNKYNQNFRNRFCGCEVNYDPFQQKCTMFQCLGLGTIENGGCGEDWYHPGCIVGLGPNWYEASNQKKKSGEGIISKGPLPSIKETPEDSTTAPDTNNNEDVTAAPAENTNDEEAEEDVPLPPGFPNEDSFEGFICYKCVEANPWIKRYAGTPGFLPAVFNRSPSPSPESDLLQKTEASQTSKKRKAEEDSDATLPSKKLKEEGEQDGLADSNSKDITIVSEEDPASASDKPHTTTATEEKPCKLEHLPPTPTGLLSLFFTSDFRTHLCHCSACFPLLAPFPHLLEEEETYEHTLSEASPHSNPNDAGSSNGGGSIYDLGESALKNVDRVRAIEGVMAYNQLKDKLKPFFQQFAESGKAISAEDIRDYFAKLRGDEEGMREAREGAKGDE